MSLKKRERQRRELKLARRIDVASGSAGACGGFVSRDLSADAQMVAAGSTLYLAASGVIAGFSVLTFLWWVFTR